MKRKGLRIALLIAILVMLLSCLGCGEYKEEFDNVVQETVSESRTTVIESEYTQAETTEPITARNELPLINSNHGSAAKLDGKVVLVSVFVNDAGTSWDYNSDTDKALLRESLDKLGEATAYISENASNYGKQVSFIYDWTVDRDLVYTAFFDEDMVTFSGDFYYKQTDWVEDNIDISRLQMKYNTENILFIFFFNTDYSNDIRSWAISYDPFDQQYVMVEIANFYMKFDNIEMPAASYAHEILHTFGAQDLYAPNNIITQDYVDYMASIASNDIMYTVSAYGITNDFSPLDAYYVGLAPRPYEADVWSLGKSEHDLY